MDSYTCMVFSEGPRYLMRSFKEEQDSASLNRLLIFCLYFTLFVSENTISPLCVLVYVPGLTVNSWILNLMLLTGY